MGVSVIIDMKTKGRIAKRPWWTRRRMSCPNCGAYAADQEDRLGKPGATFKCGTCSEQMSAVDFWKLHNDKYSYKYEEEDPLEW